MKTGDCPKCHEHKCLTRHHIKPKRFFGNKRNKEVLWICRECHSKLEFFIPQQQKMCDRFYYEIIALFLGQESFRANT